MKISVAYVEKEKRILPFHKIRNHVTRRGLYLGTDHDSPPRAHDHLMIIYYDILLLEDESLLQVRHSERIKLLESLIEHRAGWAETVKRRVIDFGTHHAASDLRNVFAEVITSKQEGLVIKPDEPYFDLSVPGRPRSGRCIKLKKEYIGGMGDIGDFAIVGAGYDAVKAMVYRIPNLKWTYFFFGNLSNKTDVQKHGAKPRFTVMGTVELNQTLLTSVMEHGSSGAVTQEENTQIIVDIVHRMNKRPGMSVIFTSPMVFDMRCFSFVKDGNSGLWVPRFPVVTKVHFDRDYMDTITFQELQDNAQDAVNVGEQPADTDNYGNPIPQTLHAKQHPELVCITS
ncbi:DNA ligase-like protein [Emericellopsis cladophorae]|uniref:DNA ligase-like protein n=1 Tax=Emericellopsis cladophorae TaxID=2686198 RepID=A0A9P9Y434_9HYPO|nr:DNA ligase-like protein [Emericellopsis cladophorae]KAI6783001.1 DNA ligase-like protein [Emericellopsis cladophorae]